jgi:hypothetical protein
VRPKKHQRRFENVHVQGTQKNLAVIMVLEHSLERARRGDVCSVAVVLETKGSTFDCKMTGSANVAERLGRLRLIEEEILARAEEDGEIANGTEACG